MQHIAKLLPEHCHGVYSRDDELKRQAMEVSSFPFESDKMRGM